MGDDLRRLHWATSARTGTLMVREDADPAEPHVTRAARRPGLGATGAATPDADAFEEAVELAAALCRVARRRRPPAPVPHRQRPARGRRARLADPAAAPRGHRTSTGCSPRSSRSSPRRGPDGHRTAHDIAVAVTGAGADLRELGLLLGEVATRPCRGRRPRRDRDGADQQAGRPGAARRDVVGAGRAVGPGGRRHDAAMTRPCRSRGPAAPSRRCRQREPWSASARVPGRGREPGHRRRWHPWPPAARCWPRRAAAAAAARGDLGSASRAGPRRSVLALLLVLTAYLMAPSTDGTLVATLADAVPRLLTEPLPYAAGPTCWSRRSLARRAWSRCWPGCGWTRGPGSARSPARSSLYVAGALLTAGDGRPARAARGAAGRPGPGWVDLLDEHAEPDDARHRVATGPPVVAWPAPALVAAVALLPVAQRLRAPRASSTRRWSASRRRARCPSSAPGPPTPTSSCCGSRRRGPAAPGHARPYDGSQWRAATRFAPFGTARASRSLPAGELRRTSTVDRRVRRTSAGRWLPTPGDPVDVSDRDAVVDPQTGTLYDPEAGAETTYQVTAVRRRPDPERAARRDRAERRRAPRALPGSCPSCRPPLATYADRVTRARRRRTSARWRSRPPSERGRSSRPRRSPGRRYWRIEQFLFGEADTPGGRVGTSEQFATAFACGPPRRAADPARGRLPPPATRRPTAAAWSAASDALAWPEVYFDRLGWVPFSPTPTTTPSPQGRPEVAPAPPARTDAPAPARRPPPRGPEADGRDRRRRAGADAASAPWWPTAPVAAARRRAGRSCSWLLRRVRRACAHRRRGAPGAWAEVLDALAPGRPARPPGRQPATLSPTAPTGASAPPPRRRVADRAERAAFGPPGRARSDAGGRADAPRGTPRRAPLERARVAARGGGGSTRGCCGRSQ